MWPNSEVTVCRLVKLSADDPISGTLAPVDTVLKVLWILSRYANTRLSSAISPTTANQRYQAAAEFGDLAGAPRPLGATRWRTYPALCRPAGSCCTRISSSRVRRLRLGGGQITTM